MRKPDMIGSRAIALTCAVALCAAASLASAAVGVGAPNIQPSDNATTANGERIIIAQAAVAPADKPVSYSDEQAARGKKKFEGDCADCHGEDLRGGLNGGPPLRGMAFEQKYADGAPASGLFLFMSTLMPPNDPGRYSPEVYADMMAFILKTNGFQAGSPLPSDEDALGHLIMEK